MKSSASANGKSSCIFAYSASAKALAIAVLGCTSGQEDARMVSDPDSGLLDSVVDAGSDAELANQILGAGIDDCAMEEADLGLEMIPEIITVFQHSTSACAPLGSGVLVKNTGTVPLRIEGLAASAPEFGLVAGSLPVELSAGEFLPVRIYYRGNEEGSVEARLTVATSAGCRGFRLRGLRTSDILITRTHEAIDFGTVVPGGTSDVRELSVLREGPDADRTTTFSAFGSDPPELYEIVRATGPENQGGVCKTRDVELRFHAPLNAGEFEGALLWRITFESTAGASEGTMVVPLYATVGDVSLR
jgi:hypothetical protein